MSAVWSLLGAAGLLGVLQAILPLGWEGGEAMFRERLLVALLGNLVVGLAGAGFVALRRWPARSAALLGAFLGGGPLLAQAMGLGWILGLPVALAGFLAGSRVRGGTARRAAPALLACALLYLGSLVAVLGTGSSCEPLPLDPGSERRTIAVPADGAAQGAAGGPTAERPDVVLIVADTLRADAVLDPAVATPNLDALRARGAWAESAVAPSNQTLPSHLSLLCGLDVEKIGMRSNLSSWPTRTQLEEKWRFRPVAERMRAVGYRTAAVVSNPLLHEVDKESGRQGFDDGFDWWNGQKVGDTWWDLLDWKRQTTWAGWLVPRGLAEKALNQLLRRTLYPNARWLWRHHYREGERTQASVLRYLDELLADPRPYFLFAHLMDPHSPYIAPEPYRGRHTAGLERPRVGAEHPSGEYAMRVKLRNLPDDAPPEQRERLGAWLHALYLEEVAYTDAIVGEVLARLESGRRRTLILFTSDHGEMFGERGSVEHGATLFEGEIAVPLILAGAGVPEDTRLGGVAELVDVAHTLLARAGASTRAVDGRDLLAGAATEEALSVMRDGCALRDGPWKAIFRVRYGDEPEPGGYELEATALYRLDKDPGEERDLRAAHPERLAAMEVRLRARLLRDLLPELPRRELRRLEQDRLSQLGYAE